MDCKGVLKSLDRYLQGDAGRKVCTLIDDHLDGCQKCRMHVDAHKLVIDLYKNWRDDRCPSGVKIRLRKRIAREASTRPTRKR